MLLPALLFTQKIHDFIPPASASAIGAALDVPLADIYGVIEFYSMLSSTPQAATPIRICTTPSCASQGSGELVTQICQHLGVDIGEATRDGKYIVEEVECLGLCDHAPGVLVGDEMVGEATLEKIFNPGDHPRSQIYGSPLHLRARAGEIDPLSVEQFQEKGGFNGLKKVLSLSTDQVIEIVTSSGLTGRGGGWIPNWIEMEKLC